ncbi:MAG TPA: ammonium transporter [Solirubrobacterales bacterium]|nr:ammonium transporter [Solirubrobacterales bacterium]
MSKRLGLGAVLALMLSLALPSAALAQGDAEAFKIELDLVWVMLATVLVFFMQAGFMFLEIGFSRGKNVGTGVAKIFVNLGMVTLAWWAIGYGVSNAGNTIFGESGYFFSFAGEAIDAALAADTGLMLFGLAFCAVSLAIVWGTTLERIKFGAYVVFAFVFGALIYPLIAHAVWADGLLADIGGKAVLDFAGSSVVHLTGATAGLAALLLLGPRLGKYGADGKPRAIPGHSMPLVGLGVMILWIGWFGFNGGSTFATDDNLFAEVMLNTQLAVAAGILGAALIVRLKARALDVGMIGNGAIAGLVGITAPSGFVEYWAAPIIGFAAGALVVYSVLLIEKYIDDPVGALSAHGAAGIWGTLAVGLFASPRLTGDAASSGIWYGIFDGDVAFAGTLGQLAVQAVGVVATFVVVFALAYAAFYAIKQTIGLRVSEEEELAGLDISSHGLYGYPEQFIPQPEYPSTPAIEPHVAGTPVGTPASAGVGAGAPVPQRPTSS